MPEDIAVKIEHVAKDFKLPHERKNTLKEWVLHFKKPSYEHFHALQNINLEVKRGEFFGIVGRNGSGKSTLLKIIGGIYQPTRGSVTVNGTLTPFIELGIGFNPELTGRENIFLNGAILGLTRKEVVAKYDDIVAFAELDKFMDQKLKNFSSGMQVRLAFSISMQAHNDILLIDEVLAVGDEAFQRKCQRVFKDIKRSGKTVIFVTHDMRSVEEYCDRAMIIHESRVLDIGSPQKIAKAYREVNEPKTVILDRIAQNKRPSVGSIKLDSIKLNNLQHKLTTGENITVDVTFTVLVSELVQFNLYIVSEDGNYIAGINTTNHLDNYKPAAGQHTIKCIIESDQLTQGNYDINVSVFTNEVQAKLIDVLDPTYGYNTPHIKIVNSSTYQNGRFYIKAKWQEV